MQKLYRRRKQEASGLCRASRPGKVFAFSILQFEFPVLVFKGCNTLYANEPAVPLAPGCWVSFIQGDLQESTVRLVVALHLPHLCLPVCFTSFRLPVLTFPSKHASPAAHLVLLFLQIEILEY